MAKVITLFVVVVITALAIKAMIPQKKLSKIPAREKKHFKKLMELSVNAALVARKEKRFESVKIHLGIAEGFAKEADVPLPPEVEEMKKSLEKNEKN